MTLLDAPEFDEARSKRNRLIAQLSAGALVVLFIVGWLVCGRPVDWPWNWSRYVFGRAAVNNFWVGGRAFQACSPQDPENSRSTSRTGLLPP